MAYRDAPARRGPIVLVMSRSWGALVGIVGGTLICGFIAVVMSDGTRLRCERGTDTCTMRFWHGIEVLAETESIPLSKIDRAEVASKTDEEGDELRTVALVVSGERRVFASNWQNFGFEEMADWAADVNGFLGDPSRAAFERERSSGWVVWVWALASGAALLLWLVSRTKLVLDRARDVLLVRRFPLGRSLDLRLSDVRHGEVHMSSGSEPAYVLRLVMADGRTVDITGESGDGLRQKERFAEAINTALAL